MTHDEMQEHWRKKRTQVFADVNKVLKEHGIPGKIAALTVAAPKSLTDSMPAAAGGDGCKSPPCSDDEKPVSCMCRDENGHVVFKTCCVPK